MYAGAAAASPPSAPGSPGGAAGSGGGGSCEYKYNRDVYIVLLFKMGLFVLNRCRISV